jgi:hypothetical protein
VRHGFWRSHVGWFLTTEGFRTQSRYVRDWLRYPELRWLDRYDWIVPAALFAGLWLLGRAPSSASTAAMLARNEELAGALVGLGSAVCFGAMAVLTRKHIHAIRPVLLNALRLWFGVGLWFAIERRVPELSRSLVLYATLAALFGPFLSRLAVMASARHVQASTTALASLVTPALTLLLLSAAFPCATGHAQAVAPSSLGAFESSQDIGVVLHPGSAEFDAAKGTYTVAGSGENMWAAKDALRAMPIGVIPFGTGNDFVKALDLGEQPELALEALVA